MEKLGILPVTIGFVREFLSILIWITHPHQLCH